MLLINYNKIRSQRYTLKIIIPKLRNKNDIIILYILPIPRCARMPLHNYGLFTIYDVYAFIELSERLV